MPTSWSMTSVALTASSTSKPSASRSWKQGRAGFWVVHPQRGGALWLLAREYGIKGEQLGIRDEMLDWHKAPLQGWEPKIQEKSRTPGRRWHEGGWPWRGTRGQGTLRLASHSQEPVWDGLSSVGRWAVTLCSFPFHPLSPPALPRVIGTSETPIIIVGNKRDLQRGRVIPRWNVSNLVKKTWKCGYIECSAKYNWHILLLFSELLKSVGCARCKHVHTTIRFQGALRRNRCTIM